MPPGKFARRLELDVRRRVRVRLSPAAATSAAHRTKSIAAAVCPMQRASALAPIELSQLVAVRRATFAIEDALRQDAAGAIDGAWWPEPRA